MLIWHPPQKIRHGKSLFDFDTIPPAHHRPWNPRRHCIPVCNTLCNNDSQVLPWSSRTSSQTPCISTSTGCGVDDRGFHTWFLCGWPQPKLDKSASRNWCRHICPNSGTSIGGSLDSTHHQKITPRHDSPMDWPIHRTSRDCTNSARADPIRVAQIHFYSVCCLDGFSGATVFHLELASREASR